MKSFFGGIFGKKTEKLETYDSITVYLDEEIKKCKVLPLSDDTTAESVVQNLLQTNELKKIYISPNIENLYVLLLIRDTKTKTLILKRRINPFEGIKEIVVSKADDHDYVWMLQMHIEPTKLSSFRDSVTNEVYNEPIFYEQRKAAEPEKFERNGRLLKRNKKGEFKEKEFVLYKDNLIYFKPGEKNKKVSVIPLVDSRAEKHTFNIREKSLFDIKTPDQTFHLKAKSDLDMKGWISAFNSQSAIATENTIMNNIDKEIKNLEYKFEKNRNEEIISFINNFDKLMEKQIYRSFLLDFIAKEKEYIKDLNPLLEEIYALRKENNTTKWLELLDNFMNKVNDLASKYKKELEEAQPGVAIITGFESFFSHKILGNNELTILSNNYGEVKGEFTEDKKQKILKILDDMLQNISNFCKEKYCVLIQSNSKFQEKLTDCMKQSFFSVHSYSQCMIFDAAANREASLTSVSNQPSFARPSNVNSK